MPITLLTAWRSTGWCTMGNIPRIHTTWIIHLALLISAHYCPALTFGIQTDSRRSPALAASRVTETSSSVHHLKSDGSANAELYQLLESKDSPSTTRVLLEGYVSKRRAIGKSLAFLDVVPSKCPDLRANISTHVDLDLTITPVQAILRREFFSDRNMDMTIERNDPILDYDVYHKILQPGTRVRLTGFSGPSRNAGEAMLFVSTARLILPNANPQHLRNVLRFGKDARLSLEELQSALPCIEKARLLEGLGMTNSSENSHVRMTCGELAADFLSDFPRNTLLNPSHLMGASSSQKVALLPSAPVEYAIAPDLNGLQHQTDDKIYSVEYILNARSSLRKGDQRNRPCFSPFTISGWIQNRRRFADNITVLELVDEYSSIASSEKETSSERQGSADSFEKDIEERTEKLKRLWDARVYCVLHPSAIGGDESADTYGNICASGARIMLSGFLSASMEESDSTNNSKFWVADARLLRSSWRPTVVRHVLDLLKEGKIPIDEAADSLSLPGGYAQAEEIAEGSMTTTECQWLAAELSRSLQGANSRVGRLTPDMKEALGAFEGARSDFPIHAADNDDFDEFSRGRNSGVSVILDSTGSPVRDSPTASRWQRSKRPQLEWMVSEVEDVLRSHPEYGKRTLKIIDVGGGKGHLSNLLAEHFGEAVEVNVVDISKSVINNGMMRAMRRGLENIRYDAKDATTLDVSGVDVVVALHACGALSDVALGHAVSNGAGFVICPCCFRSNPQLRTPMPKQTLVTVPEWLSVDPTQYEHLKQLAEIQGDASVSGQAMHTICALRGTAVERHWRSTVFPNSNISVNIKTFPIGFSTRNHCIIGKFN